MPMIPWWEYERMERNENKLKVYEYIGSEWTKANTYDYKIITYNQIAKRTQLNLSMIKSLINELENEGYIKSSLIEQKGNNYKTLKGYKIIKKFYG